MNKQAIETLPEPTIIIKNGTSTYAKFGLSESGPYDAGKSSHSNRIVLGIVGTKELIDKAKEWVEYCNNEITSTSHSGKEVNKQLFPDFPGCDIAFNTKLVVEESYTNPIVSFDLINLGDGKNIVAYSNNLLRLFEEKIQHILDTNETKPAVIILVLTDKMFETCHSIGNYHKKIKRRPPADPNQVNLFKDFDMFGGSESNSNNDSLYKNFRALIKKMAMNPSIGVPVQIVREETIKFDSELTQNAATKAWNFCTGLYYKSGRQPWILNDIDPDTCYMGISFFHKKNKYSDSIYTSMANLFANDFEDLVMKGMKVEFDKRLGSAFLNYEQAKDLLEEGLGIFENLKKSKPKRIVIHKTSTFTDEETKGFVEILNDQKISYDLVTIRKADIRLVRYGDMPIPRGTLFSIGKDNFFLYTKGYIPELRTYPGMHIPAPFEVIKKAGDSSYKQICNEILALTKLNWNTADYCCGLPITLGFSQNVGQVLKEFGDRDSFAPQKSYRFYM